jgi:phenylacetate-coenzyme A ligase PaaK-like adenylate-forming protein
MGLGPRLPRRRKLASVMAATPQHMTARMTRSTDVGIHRFLRLDAREPISRLVAELNAFQPEALAAYASVAAMLADEQIAGRLTIAPTVVSATSEVLTADMAARISAAWDRTPFNIYGTTETGMLACDCDRHAGLHLFEDLVHVEVVDDSGRPVPDGTPGSRMLITNLINRTQPLIRYELTDLVTISPERCPCGRPFKMIEKIDGRTDDVLSLASPAGGEVTVHPLVLRSPLAKVAGLRQYRIVHDDHGLHVEAVLMDDCGEQTRAELRSRLCAALEEAGAGATPVDVVQVEAIERHAGSGKAKLIESRRSAAAGAAR